MLPFACFLFLTLSFSFSLSFSLFRSLFIMTFLYLSLSFFMSLFFALTITLSVGCGTRPQRQSHVALFFCSPFLSRSLTLGFPFLAL
jgi:hypothetical protein